MQILSYDDVLKELDLIVSNGDFKIQDDIYTKYGIKIPYYTYGNGSNHIVVCGGIHGSEIITVDFVLKLMSEISIKNYTDYTFHFIPVLNPEGYIVSTSCVLKELSGDIEKFCKEYFERYRMDCIEDRKGLKLHQEMFKNTSYLDIPLKYNKLRESISKICLDNKFPNGSMVIWRGNGDGVDLNREHELMDLSLQNHTYFSDNLRYNNIVSGVPGPLGTYKNVVESVENTFLFSLIQKLYIEKKYAGIVLYHSTGGMVYYEPSKDNCLYYDKYLKINEQLVDTYISKTIYECSNGLKKMGYVKKENTNINSNDEFLRVKYPGVILVELSYMGGNPLGPYGDKINNYDLTMSSNIDAFLSMIEVNKKLKNDMY